MALQHRHAKKYRQYSLRGNILPVPLVLVPRVDCPGRSTQQCLKQIDAGSNKFCAIAVLGQQHQETHRAGDIAPISMPLTLDVCWTAGGTSTRKDQLSIHRGEAYMGCQRHSPGSSMASREGPLAAPCRSLCFLLLDNALGHPGMAHKAPRAEESGDLQDAHPRLDLSEIEPRGAVRIDKSLF